MIRYPREPLRGAIVQLVRVDSSQRIGAPVPTLTTTSNASGAFAFVDVAPGRYAIGFDHAELGVFALDQPIAAIEVGSVDVSVRLAIPGGVSLRRHMCGAASEGGAMGR